MGPKLPVLAALILAGLARDAAAESSAAQMMKDGIEAYKAAKYDVAVLLLARSYELDAKLDTLFALAQAERLAGDCKSAVPHYKKLLAQTPGLDAAKLIQSNLVLCDPQALDPKPAPVAEPAKQVTVAPEPKIVVREVHDGGGGTSMLNVALLAGGTAAIGGAIGLGLVSRADRDDAASARTFDRFNELNDRADRYRTYGFIAGGLGVAFVGIAIVRWVIAKPTASGKEVALVPTASGVGVVARW